MVTLRSIQCNEAEMLISMGVTWWFIYQYTHAVVHRELLQQLSVRRLMMCLLKVRDKLANFTYFFLF